MNKDQVLNFKSCLYPRSGEHIQLIHVGSSDSLKEVPVILWWLSVSHLKPWMPVTNLDMFGIGQEDQMWVTIK